MNIKKLFVLFVLVFTSSALNAQDSIHHKKVCDTDEGEIYVGEVEYGKIEFVRSDGWHGDILQETSSHLIGDSVFFMPGLRFEKGLLNNIDLLLDNHNKPSVGHHKVRKAYYPSGITNTAREYGVYFNVELPVEHSTLSKSVTMTFSKIVQSHIKEMWNFEGHPLGLFCAENGQIADLLCDYYGKEVVSNIYNLRLEEEIPVTNRQTRYFFFQPQFQSSELISYFFYTEDMGSLMGHEQPYSQYITFNKETGDVLKLEDIIAEEYKIELAELVVEKMRLWYNMINSKDLSLAEYKHYLANETGSLMSTASQWSWNKNGELEHTESNNVFDIENFSIPVPGLTDEGLIFIYQPYEVDAFVSGTYYITVPYAEIKSWMKINEPDFSEFQHHGLTPVFESDASKDNSYYEALFRRDYQNALKLMQIEEETVDSEIERIKLYHSMAIAYYYIGDFENAAKYDGYGIAVMNKTFGDNCTIEYESDELESFEDMKSRAFELIANDNVIEGCELLEYTASLMFDESKTSNKQFESINLSDEAMDILNIAGLFYLEIEARERVQKILNLIEQHELVFRRDVELNSLLLKIRYEESNPYVDIDTVISLCQTASDKAKNYLKSSLLSSTEEERQKLWRIYQGLFLKELPRIAHKHKTYNLSCIAYDALLFGKGYLLSASRSIRQIILDSGNNEALSMFDKLQNEKNEFEELKHKGNSAVYLLKERNVKINELERKLAEKAGEYKDYLNRTNVSWKDISQNLKQDEIAVEFYLKEEDGLNHYNAMIVGNGWKSPVSVNLLISKDNLSTYFTEDIEDHCSSFWDSIICDVEEVKTIYFSPIGELNNYPLEIAEEKLGIRFIRLSSTREIIEKREKNHVFKGVLCGGLNYGSDMDISPIHAFSQRGAINEISYLKGSLKEVNDIEEIIKESSKKWEIKSLTGAMGTEDAIKALSGFQYSIMHFATHGFYFQETLQERWGVQVINENDALSRCGLCLSGAKELKKENLSEFDELDGLLTAREISYLDFGKLNLVSLSACETALGDITGDGVFGLQRGFKKAGAQSILMSLWKVDDEATCLLMTKFYKNWIGEGKTKHDALELAKQSVRSHKEKGWDNPKYWAAFVLLDALD